MKLVTKLNTIAVATAVIAASATASLADTKVAGVTGFNPSPLIVLSNGQEYTKLDVLGMTNIAVNLQYDVGVAGSIKSWTAEPTITNGYGIASQIQNLDQYKISKSYPFGSRPNTMNRNEVINVPASRLNDAAVGMCNWKANSLRQQGKTNKSIFGSNQEVSFEVDVIFKVDAGGAGSNDVITEYTAPKVVPVICQKWSGAQVPTVGGLSTGLDVKKATMQLKPVATLAGACQVKLTTAISTNTPNATVKYRYVHSSGKKSKVFEVKTAANMIAVVKADWDIPNGAGPEIGWMQMEGVNVNFQSNKAGYRMNCKTGGETGGFAPTPGKPTVRVPLGGGGKLSN